MEIWLLDIRKPNFVLLVLANFTNDFPCRLKGKQDLPWGTGDQGCPGMSVDRGCPGLRGLRRTPLLTEFCRSCGGSKSMAIAEGGLGPIFDRQCEWVRSPVAGGLGHAMFVGAVACGLSWRDGRSSVFGVHGSSREVLPVSIVVVRDSDCLLVGYFLQWERGTRKEQTMFAILSQEYRGSN
ncbi:hypothetical protein CDL15_Pgr000212 [Punica granatum]|uniref:Uncharacterized protein n=1 Tax=Punica granatum TaxID=22663 RepID=A0A218Y2I4_PUNGR|nr:hypothetical protein CDL15_Pgr000212 [Punica granatum]